MPASAMRELPTPWDSGLPPLGAFRYLAPVAPLAQAVADDHGQPSADALARALAHPHGLALASSVSTASSAGGSVPRTPGLMGSMPTSPGLERGGSGGVPRAWAPTLNLHRVRMAFLSVMVTLFRSFRMYIRDAEEARGPAGRSPMVRSHSLSVDLGGPLSVSGLGAAGAAGAGTGAGGAQSSPGPAGRGSPLGRAHSLPVGQAVGGGGGSTPLSHDLLDLLSAAMLPTPGAGAGAGDGGSSTGGITRQLSVTGGVGEGVGGFTRADRGRVASASGLLVGDGVPSRHLVYPELQAVAAAPTPPTAGSGLTLKSPRQRQFVDVFDLESFLTEQTHEETRALIKTLVNDVMAFRMFVHERVQISKQIDLFDR
jgi:hypothetical protein